MPDLFRHPPIIRPARAIGTVDPEQVRGDEG